MIDKLQRIWRRYVQVPWLSLTTSMRFYGMGGPHPAFRSTTPKWFLRYASMVLHQDRGCDVRYRMYLYQARAELIRRRDRAYTQRW